MQVWKLSAGSRLAEKPKWLAQLDDSFESITSDATLFTIRPKKFPVEVLKIAAAIQLNRNAKRYQSLDILRNQFIEVQLCWVPNQRKKAEQNCLPRISNAPMPIQGWMHVPMEGSYENEGNPWVLAYEGIAIGGAHGFWGSRKMISRCWKVLVLGVAMGKCAAKRQKDSGHYGNSI